MSGDPILTALTAILGRLDSLDGRMERLETGQEGLRAEVSKLQTDMTKLQTDMTSLRSETRAFRGGMTEELGATRVAIMERIDRLQTIVNMVKDDIIVNHGSDDRVERIAKAASDETRALGEIVRAMQRQIARLRTDLEQLRDDRDTP